MHAVVCNAGMQAGTTVTTTADGFESTFGVNHLGHFLLMNELMPQMRAPGRVVVVSSGVHDPANKSGVPAPAWNSPDALARGELGPASAADRPFVSGQRRYSTSKLANVYFTYGLARHLPHGVTANAFNPGLMPGTGLLREAVAPARFMVEHVLPRVMPLARLVLGSSVHSVEESGAALGRLVTDPRFAGVTGKYFSQTDEVRSSDESYDEARAEELWKWSLELTARSAS